MDIVEIFKVILLSIIEGITEWLPVSSTGHMYLIDEFIPLSFTPSFKEVFFVVIQLGAILAVLLKFWRNLLPLKRSERKIILNRQVCSVWLKVAVACIPTAILGIFLDDFLNEHLYNVFVISIMLILYGIAFLIVETKNKKRIPRICFTDEIDVKTSLLFGIFQSLAMIPGTSRSGATILGGICMGVSRKTSAEFSFYLAIPTMFGASLLKLLKFFLSGDTLTSGELSALIVGMGISFAVSLLVIDFLMNFVKKHDFKIFGWYRILLGAVLLALFLL